MAITITLTITRSDNDSEETKRQKWLRVKETKSGEIRFWLEASTLSNRGEMRQHLPTDDGQTPYRWLEASTPVNNEW